MPVYYECQRCTACCRWPGQVRLSEAEITALASLKKISETVFIQQYTRVTHDRTGLALQDKPNGECVFLDGEHCVVQEAKPQQCRDFPNLWSFPGFSNSCHAIAHDVSTTEYLRLVSQATQRPVAEIQTPKPPDAS